MADTPSDLSRLLSLVQGFRASQVTYVVAKLGIADRLAESPRTADELAAGLGVNADRLGRTLRLAAYYGIVAEVSGRRFELTAIGRPLCTGVAGSVKATAVMLGEEHYRAWADLLYSVRTGEPAFDHVFGAPFFDYMTAHPETQATFDAAMSDGVDVFYTSLAESFDFAKSRVVVDVGGGNGSLSAVILKRHPHIEAVIYDQPQVLGAADRYLSSAGVRSRCRLVPGNFFESVPEGGDAYLLSNIVHDWDDERALRILRNCRAAMAPLGAVLLVESVFPEHGQPSRAAMFDVNMMVVLTGRERTEQQYRALFTAADLQLTRVTPISGGECLIEARPR
jgi:O-methyltransferase domain